MTQSTYYSVHDTVHDSGNESVNNNANDSALDTMYITVFVIVSSAVFMTVCTYAWISKRRKFKPLYIIYYTEYTPNNISQKYFYNSTYVCAPVK